MQFYSEDFKSKVRTAHNDGLSFSELSRQCGASVSSIRLWCDPGAAERHLQYHANYRNNPEIDAHRRAYRKSWYSKNKGIKRAQNEEWKAKNPVRYWASSAMWSAKKRAAEHGVPFDITIDDLLAVYPHDGLCPIFGVVLTPNSGIDNRLTSPSIDRIVPSKGYVVGNIAVISARANTIKSNASPDDLLAVASWLKSKL